MNKIKVSGVVLIALAVITSLAFWPGKYDGPRTDAELGEKLFFDPILSADSTISCASCHKPEFAFADNVPLSFGVDSLTGTRNAPTAMNLDGHDPLFHDGRAATLEEQVSGPIANPVEMNLPLDKAIERLARHPLYSKWFRKVYHQQPTVDNLQKAIAAYERTLFTANTPFDRYMKGDKTAMSESAQRGRILFNEKARCFDCHKGPDFTNDEFRNIGLYDGKSWNDAGRFDFTKDTADKGKFRVPSLRNIAVTGPYMHNGRMKTLDEVINYYNDPDETLPHVKRDSLVKQLRLTQQEKEDIKAFLEALTDDRFARRKP